MTYYVTITVPPSSVGETLTDFPLFIDLSDMPSGFWEHLVYDSGADIRVKDEDGNDIPFDIVSLSRVDQTGSLFVKTGISLVGGATISIHYGDDTLDLVPVTDPNGRNAVWSNFHRVFTFGDYHYDRTGSGVQLDFFSSFWPQLNQESISSPDTGCGRGSVFDGTYYYTVGVNSIKKYNTSWSLIDSNSDPVGDAGLTASCGGCYEMNGILYIPMYTAAYTTVVLSEFDAETLDFIQSREMTAPGGVTWAFGPAYVPEWDKFVFCDYADGSKLWLHNNDATLSYDGYIDLSQTITNPLGVTYWNRTFWISGSSADRIYVANRDGSQTTYLGDNSLYSGTSGISWYGNAMYLTCYTTTSPETGYVTKLSLHSIDSTGTALELPDTAAPSHRAKIEADRFTEWTIGIGQHLERVSISYGNSIIAYGDSADTGLTPHVNLYWLDSTDLVNTYNSDDGTLSNEPRDNPPIIAYKDNFSGYTTSTQPPGWTERYDTWRAALNVRSDSNSYMRRYIDVTGSSSGLWGASIDDLGDGVTDFEMLTTIRFNNAYTNLTRLCGRASGTGGSGTNYSVFFTTTGAQAVGLYKMISGTSYSKGYVSLGLTTGLWYHVRWRVVGSSIKIRMWLVTEDEPETWSFETTDSDISSGWVGLYKYSSYNYPVDFDYMGVSTGVNPATVPLPEADIGEYSRAHLRHNGTTERKFFINGISKSEAPCTAKPGVDADALFVGFNNPNYNYGTKGKLSYLYLINEVLSDNWIAAEDTNIDEPSSFYTMGAECECNGTVEPVGSRLDLSLDDVEPLDLTPIQFSDLPAFSQEVILDEIVVRLTFTWNNAGSFWNMDVYNSSGETLISGIRLVLGYDLFTGYKTRGLPPGKLMVVDPTEDLTEVGFEDFQNERGLQLVYLKNSNF